MELYLLTPTKQTGRDVFLSLFLSLFPLCFCWSNHADMSIHSVAPLCQIYVQEFNILKPLFLIKVMSCRRRLQVTRKMCLIRNIYTPLDEHRASSSALMVWMGVQNPKHCEIVVSRLSWEWRSTDTNSNELFHPYFFFGSLAFPQRTCWLAPDSSPRPILYLPFC